LRGEVAVNAANAAGAHFEAARRDLRFRLTQLWNDYYYLNRAISVTDENGTIAYVFDDANRFLSITYPGNKSLGYEYNLINRRTRLTYTDESYVDYTYDALNRMDQVKDQGGNVLADYSYDTVNRTGLQYLNGTDVTYQHNDANWVMGLFNTQTNQGDISSFTYTHDRARNRKTMSTSWGTQTYTYDNIYQVTHVDYPAGHPFADKTYNYDSVGNRDSTVNGGTVEYAHNELNEYTSVDWTTFTSDLRGNLINDGDKVYSYDLQNKLTAVNGNINYEYNPFGLRISKTVNGNTSNYVLDNNRVIEEWEDGNLVRKFIYGVGIDEPLVMKTGGSKYFYHFDALGNVRNLTDSTGTTVASYKYDIFGDFQLSGSSHGNPYTFTGRRHDSESDLFYYRARYYSPNLGRFLQTDPIVGKKEQNLYVYILNNVINHKDPQGLFSSYEICMDNCMDQADKDYYECIEDASIAEALCKAGCWAGCWALRCKGQPDVASCIEQCEASCEVVMKWGCDLIWNAEWLGCHIGCDQDYAEPGPTRTPPPYPKPVP
jgi:RHS repeat-associated protein